MVTNLSASKNAAATWCYSMHMQTQRRFTVSFIAVRLLSGTRTDGRQSNHPARGTHLVSLSLSLSLASCCCFNKSERSLLRVSPLLHVPFIQRPPPAFRPMHWSRFLCFLSHWPIMTSCADSICRRANCGRVCGLSTLATVLRATRNTR